MNDNYSAKTYVLSWDCTGLESVVCLSDIAKEETWQALKQDHTQDNGGKGRADSISNIVYRLTMRARFNTQRFYEIYLIDVDESISDATLRKMFEDAPQAMADLVRSRGRVLYSDRPNKDHFKIT